MCLYCGEVRNGRLHGPLTTDLAEQWARAAPITPPDLAALSASSDAQAAAALNVPADQIHVARCAAT
jgi:hypothetical protein